MKRPGLAARAAARTMAVAVLLATFSGACRRRSSAEARSHLPPSDAARGPASPQAGSWRALDLPTPLAKLLETGAWDKTPRGFRVVALSFLADGCARRAAADPSLRGPAVACISRAIELAAATRPKDLDVGAANDGLWLSHLNLMLGARDRLAACPDPKRHAAVAEALARRSLREPTFHVPSFAGDPHRWPADQTATLASLQRFDRAHGTHLVDEPLRRWRDRMLKKEIDRRLGLPWSEATGTVATSREPRGCALSFETRFLAEVDSALAADWWRRYKESYLVDSALLVGFREWPPGRARPADLDSGPIVRSVGAAATALALPAARVMDDGLLAARLRVTAEIVGTWAAHDPAMARQASNLLAAAILFLGSQ